MKRLLEYLLLFVVIAVLWGSADNAVYAPVVGDLEDIVVGIVTFNEYK